MYSFVLTVHNQLSKDNGKFCVQTAISDPMLLCKCAWRMYHELMLCLILHEHLVAEGQSGRSIAVLTYVAVVSISTALFPYPNSVKAKQPIPVILSDNGR